MSILLKPFVSNESVCEILKNAIHTKTPFSLIRLGDGEIHYLNNTVPESLSILVNKLWNYSNADVVPILHNAIYDADIIGIMDQNNVIVSKIKYKESEWSISNDYINDIHKDNNYLICDHQITRSELIGNIYNFKHILNGNSLNIISPNKELLDINLSSILEADVTITLIDNNRTELLNKLSYIKSDVVIYGTSLFGKDIGTILKNNYNKVCIDFGATLDAWAGKRSRKWFNEGNIQDYCLIKL